MARSNLRRASVILEEAQSLHARGAWNLVVRRAQEAVELALKGCLLWASIEVPHMHDVGVILRQHHDRFPAWFGEQIPLLVSVSRALAAERERSFYGDERIGLPPEALYGEFDASEALEKAASAVQICRSLVEAPGH